MSAEVHNRLQQHELSCMIHVQSVEARAETLIKQEQNADRARIGNEAQTYVNRALFAEQQVFDKNQQLVGEVESVDQNKFTVVVRDPKPEIHRRYTIQHKDYNGGKIRVSQGGHPYIYNNTYE